VEEKIVVREQRGMKERKEMRRGENSTNQHSTVRYSTEGSTAARTQHSLPHYKENE
jgi:hypothetical protein